MDWMKSIAQPASTFSTTGAAAGAAACTFTKPPQNSQLQSPWGIFITKIVMSCTAAPVAAIEATLTGPVQPDGTQVTIKIEIPAAAFAPIVIDYGTHPLRCKAFTDAVLTIPAVGGSAVATATIHGYYGPTS